MLFFFVSIVLGEETDENSDGSIIVEDKRNDTDQVGSASVINVEKMIKQADLGELLSQQTSVNIRRFGGLGDYSTLSVRGAASEQTTIMINGIPLNPEGSASINLSELPLSAFSQVELYRSHVPPELQSASIGGVVNLIPNREKHQKISTGIGSFETTNTEVSLTQKVQKNELLIFARHFQTQGNFEYFDDNATIYNFDDDHFRVRNNNSKHQQNIFIYDAWKNISFLHHTHFQHGDVAGSIIMPFQDVSLSTSRHLTSLLWKDLFPLFSHQISAWHNWDRSILEDPQGEIFGSIQSQYQTTHQLGIRGYHQFFYSDHFIPSLGWGTRIEQNQNQDLLSNTSLNQQRILSQLQLGTQLFLSASRLENHASVQIYHFHVKKQNQLFLAPKTSALFHISKYWALWASANRSFRPPTMMELYGNQGSIIGNPDLIPETAMTLDGGIVWNQTFFSFQAGYFHRWGKDNIILIQNAQNQSIPFNFAKTRVQGLESNVTIHPKNWINWTLGCTLNHSLNLSDIASMQGNQLPNIPKWNLQHQLKLKNDYASIQHVWFFIDQNYSESTNRYLYPTRSFHNIELASNQKGFFPSASLAFRNLLNTITEEALLDPLQPALGKREQAVSDFIGYPLPGRHLFLTLTWNTR